MKSIARQLRTQSKHHFKWPFLGSSLSLQALFFHPYYNPLAQSAKHTRQPTHSCNPTKTSTPTHPFPSLSWAQAVNVRVQGQEHIIKTPTMQYGEGKEHVTDRSWHGRRASERKERARPLTRHVWVDQGWLPERQNRENVKKNKSRLEADISRPCLQRSACC